MSIEEQFAIALKSEEPMWQLRAVVQNLLVQGYDRARVISSLETYRLLLRESGQEADEDVVLEILDFLHGWCHADRKP